jgi:site-specific recombinase XerD
MTLMCKGDKERAVVIPPGAAPRSTTTSPPGRTPPPPSSSAYSPTTVGKPTENRLTDAGARHVCRQVARRLGLSRFSPPVLRHTLGTLPQGEMGDVRLTAEVFGHSGLGSVAGYTKVAATHLREGYRRMEARGL